MNWNRITTIARWEYFQKVRSKGFILSLILTPILMVGFGVLPSMLADQGPDETKTVGVIDRTGTFFPLLKNRLETTELLPGGEPAYVLANYAPAGRPIDSAYAAADRDAVAEITEGTIVIEDSAGTPKASFRSPNPSNIRLLSRFENAIEQINIQRHLKEIGVDTAVYDNLTQDIDLATVKVSNKGEEKSGGFLATFLAAYAGSFLLMFLILTTGQSLVRSLVEEKSNRIMELLVGMSTPQELMWGKLLGLTGLGVTQLFAWAVLGLGAVTLMADPGGMSTWLKDVYAVLPYMVIYMVLGYLFYSAIFIGVGSLVTTEQEAQVATSYLVMLLLVPTVFAIAVVQNPDASYVRILSYIPLFTPSMMMIRIVTKMPPLWEVFATTGVLLLSTVVVIWAAGRIFRTAILMYGKRPSLGEIVRWLKDG